MILVFGLALKLDAQSLSIQLLSSESLRGIKGGSLHSLSNPLDSIRTNAEGYVRWTTTSYLFEIRAKAYRTDTVSLDFTKGKVEDTLFFFLSPIKAELLEEVAVSPKPSWINAVSFQTFEPLGSHWLFQTKKELILADSELKLLDRVSVKALGLHKEELFRDVFGNLFLLDSDSVMQIFLLDGKMHFYPKESRTEFNWTIPNILGKTDGSNRILRDVSKEEYSFKHTFRISGIQQAFSVEHPIRHNCGLRVWVFRNEESPILLYESLDTSAYEAAQHYFSKYIQATIRYWSLIHDSGIVSSIRKEQMAIAKSVYDNMYARKLDVFWLNLEGNTWLLFDPYSEKIVRVEYDLQTTSELAFKFDLLASEAYLIHDLLTDKVYFRLKKRGASSLVEVSFSDEKIEWLTEYTVQAYARNLRINGSVLLYLNDRDELKIKRL